ncbi:hypothetical protein GJ744_007178 [Endocarpon pusillum]|uniref:Uncharacterized protein n=1 Tax=Endocarpon pusillum TaxID=364733 RepID=A0A8H7AKZ8_9EURO|nr:hypothetical protein GJ744_007178 [Endocarpon pusillum]
MLDNEGYIHNTNDLVSSTSPRRTKSSPYEKEAARRVWLPSFRTKQQTKERETEMAGYFLETGNNSTQRDSCATPGSVSEREHEALFHYH